MKADPEAQRRLLDLQALDTALAQLAHRRRTLPEHAELDRLGREVSSLDDERAQRPGRPSTTSTATSSGSSATSSRCGPAPTATRPAWTPAPARPSELEALQHELETLARRQRELEDAELELMEKREEAAGGAGRGRAPAGQGPRPSRPRSSAAATSCSPASPRTRSSAGPAASRSPPTCRADLVKLYEQIREQTGIGAALLRAGRCEGCRLELSGSEKAAGAGRRRRTRWCAATSAGASWSAPPSRGCERALRVIVEADGGSRGNPGPAGYGAVVLDAETGDGARRAGRGDRHRHQQRRRVRRADRRAAGGRRAGRRRGRGPDGLQARRRADVRPLADQASRAAPARRAGGRPGAPVHVGALRVDAARAQQAGRRARQRGDGRGGRHRATGARAAVVAEPDAAGAADCRRPPLAGPRLGRAAGGRARWPPARVGGAGAGGRAGAGTWEPRTGTPLRLLLVRHGETALTAQRRYSGRGDVPLTERGLAQARGGGARRLAAPGGADRRRGHLAAGALRAHRRDSLAAGAPIVVDDDLIECDFGDWEGLTFAEVRERWPDELAAWLASTAVAPPGGESFDAVADAGARGPSARLRPSYPSGRGRGGQPRHRRSS